MKPGTYRQCYLTRGVHYQTAWIPEKFAKTHKRLKIKNWDDEWEDGWIVAQVYQSQTAEVVEVLEDQHRRNRKITDV